MLRDWLKRWENWIGDRDMKEAIRSQLRAEGKLKPGVEILGFRAAAIERPGWVIVYEFRVETPNDTDVTSTIYGVARDDSRSKTIVRLFNSEPERNRQRDQWSEGLILSPHLRERHAKKK